MKRTKRLIAFILCLVSIAALMGCSAKEETTEIDIDTLVSELLEKVEFEDELNEIDDTLVKRLYNIESYVKAAVYVSSGATAEEIAVFEFDSEAAAANGLEMAQARIERQKADYEAYIPQEVQRLDNAVVKQSGRYVIVCVSSGDEAKNIIA